MNARMILLSNNKWLLVSLIFFFINSNGYSQQLPTAKAVTNRYWEAIGGKKRWRELNSRISFEKVSLYQSDAPIATAYKFMDYYKGFQTPNSYLDAWYEGLHYSILAETSTCKWLYYDTDLSLMFLGKKRNKEPTTYPRIKPLEILNYQMMDSVIIENDFYRIDFIDTDWNRIMSVYFDKTSYLIMKHSYSNSGIDKHEYYYNDYREQNGYFEPYSIVNFVDGKKYKTIDVQRISYNSIMDPSVFGPPVNCADEGVLQLEKRMVFPFSGN